MPKCKIVGGALYPNGKGEITIPPAGAVEKKIGDGFIEIPLESRGKDSVR